jgi:hypothetical protein
MAIPPNFVQGGFSSRTGFFKSRFLGSRTLLQATGRRRVQSRGRLELRRPSAAAPKSGLMTFFGLGEKPSPAACSRPSSRSHRQRRGDRWRAAPARTKAAWPGPAPRPNSSFWPDPPPFAPSADPHPTFPFCFLLRGEADSSDTWWVSSPGRGEALSKSAHI